jgi:hypothetical protein
MIIRPKRASQRKERFVRNNQQTLPDKHFDRWKNTVRNTISMNISENPFLALYKQI